MRRFLMCYQCFKLMKPDSLLDLLITRYLSESLVCMDSQSKQSKQLRGVLCFLTIWIKAYPDDFDKEMNKQLMHFLVEIVAFDTPLKPIAIKLYKTFIENVLDKKPVKLIRPKSLLILQPQKSNIKVKQQIQDIAQTLTAFGHTLFGRIIDRELVGWIVSKSPDDQPNIKNLLLFERKVRNWVICQLVKTKDEKERRENLILWIQILSQLYSLNSVSVFCAVIKALKSPPVSRLYSTWNSISNKYKKMIKELSDEAGNITSNDFIKIIEWTNKLKPPLLPNLGILYQSVSQYNEQEPTIIMDPNGDKFNFKKLFKICKNVEKYRAFQEMGYSYEINNDIMNEFNSCEMYSEEELLAMSKEVEQ